jgi:hypothetical protein
MSKWSVQRSAVRSIVWLGLSGHCKCYGHPHLVGFCDEVLPKAPLFVSSHTYVVELTISGTLDYIDALNSAVTAEVQQVDSTALMMPCSRVKRVMQQRRVRSELAIGFKELSRLRLRGKMRH